MRGQQVKQVLEEVLDPVGHVDALVIMFAMITDIEKVHFADLLGHKSYRLGDAYHPGYVDHTRAPYTALGRVDD